MIKRSLAEKDMGILKDKKLSMSQERVLEYQKANCILGCSKRSMRSRYIEGLLLFYSIPVNAHLEYCV